MESLIILSVWIAFGMITCKMADSRGRNGWLGFFAGLFFGIFAIAYYAVAGDTSEKRAEAVAEALRGRKRK